MELAKEYSEAGGCSSADQLEWLFDVDGAIYYGFSANLSMDRLQSNGSMVLAFNPKGNIALQIANGTAGTTTPSTVDISFSYIGVETNAEDIKDLEGSGQSVGGGLPLPPIKGVPLGLSLDKVHGLDTEGNVIWTGTGIATTVGTTKPEGHLSFSQTGTMFYFHRANE